MGPDHKHSQVTILPKQFRRLASLSRQVGGAIGVSQTGSTLHIHTGESKFDIDAQGETIDPSNKGNSC